MFSGGVNWGNSALMGKTNEIKHKQKEKKKCYFAKSLHRK